MTTSSSSRDIDGGWGWVATFSLAVVHCSVGLSQVSHSLFYPELIASFSLTAAESAWPGALYMSGTYFFGFLSAILCERFSPRAVCVLSGVLVASGWIISSLTANLYVLSAAGLIAGSGGSIGYVAATIVSMQYFRKRRSIAQAIAACGFSSGYLLGAYLSPLLVRSYGLSGAMLILGGITLNVCVAGLLLRPCINPWATSQGSLDIIRDIVNDNDHSYTTTYNKTIADNCSSAELEVFPAVNTQFKNMDRNRSQPQGQLTHMEIDTFAPSPEEPSHPENSTLMSERTTSIDLKPVKKSISGKAAYVILVKKGSFWVVFLCIMFYHMALASADIQLPALLQEKGITENIVSLTLSLGGLVDMAVQCLGGLLFDFPRLRPHRHHLFCLFILVVGLSYGTLGLVRSHPTLIAMSIVSMLRCHLFSQRAIILTDIFGLELLGHVVGLVMIGEGVASFGGPPIAGAIKDASGSFSLGYCLFGVTAFMAMFTLEIFFCCTKFKQREK